jgi:hypothetical protein
MLIQIPQVHSKRRFSTGLVVATLLISTHLAAEQDLEFGTWSPGEPAPGHMLATHST